VIDSQVADELQYDWISRGLGDRVPLDLVECPDRRINRAVLEVVAEAVADGNTEVSVLIPRREYSKFWHRFLHDHTADSIAKTLTDVPHANVTFVPYHLGKRSAAAKVAAELVGGIEAAENVFTNAPGPGDTNDSQSNGSPA